MISGSIKKAEVIMKSTKKDVMTAEHEKNAVVRNRIAKGRPSKDVGRVMRL